MANTYVKIATVTVGAGGQASIDFSSIPATYTDLKVVLSLRSSVAAAQDRILIAFNGLTTNYSLTYLMGDGASASSGTRAAFGDNMAGYIDAASNTASVFASTEIYIPSYLSANNKSVSIESVHEDNATTGRAILLAGLWSSSAAINRLTFTPASGPNFTQYSMATLYGIKSS